MAALILLTTFLFNIQRRRRERRERKEETGESKSAGQ
jgi:hypothetical protein